MKKIKISRRGALHIVFGGLVALPAIRIGWYKFNNRKVKREVIFDNPIEYGYALLEEMQRKDLENIGDFAQIYQIYGSKARRKNLSDKFHVTFRFLGNVDKDRVIEAELTAIDQHGKIAGYNRIIQKDPRRTDPNQTNFSSLGMSMDLAVISCELDKGKTLPDLKRIVLNLESFILPLG